MQLEDLYGEYTDEAAEEEAKKFRKKYMKLNTGPNIVRVLPAPRDPETKQLLRSEPWIVMFEHNVEFPGNIRLRTSCPRVMNDGARCPICDEVKRRKALNNAKDKKIAEGMDVRRRVYVEVINRGDPAGGVLLLEVGKTIHDDFIRLRRDKVSGGFDFTHPIKGCDVNIHREQTGKSVREVKYTCALARQSSPLAQSQEQMIEWLTNRIDLSDKRLVPSYEEILAMIEEKKVASLSASREERESRPSREAIGGNGTNELPASTGTIPEDMPPPPQDDDFYPEGDEPLDDIPFSQAL
jgi:hypothetical protein